MIRLPLLSLTAAALIAWPFAAGAQQATTATPAPATAAAPPTTSGLNNAVAAANADVAEANAVNEGQYQADLLVYRKAVAAHSTGTMGDQARYEKQQRLYADAMAAWRKQDAACKTGDTEGCKHPSPDPKDFY